MDPISENEFRILTILPGSEGSPIECDRHLTRLSSGSQFEALSYVWGPRTNLVKINVAGQQVEITTSLHEVLCRLRYTDKPSALWIDQLCINQEDLMEKTAQVQQMRNIYSKCTRCLLWMGEVNETFHLSDAANALDFIQYLAAFANGKKPWKPAFLDVMSLFDTAMRALRTIAVQDGAWWHRVWTVQEAMLPDKKVFLWGPLSITWSTMAAARAVWVSNSDVPIPHILLRTAAKTGDMSNLMARITWLSNRKLDEHDPLGAVVMWRDRVAMDLCDNVYALTGLYNPGLLPRTERCDYSLDGSRAFVNFTADLISMYGLQPLILDTYLEDDAATKSTPRWALDMKSWPRYPSFHWHHHWGYLAYNANKGLPANQTFRIDGLALELRGKFVDVVQCVGETQGFTEDNYPTDMPSASFLNSWLRLYEQTFILVNGSGNQQLEPAVQEHRRRFCRLLLGDIMKNNEWRVDQPAGSQDVDRILQFLDTGDEAYRHRTVRGATMNQRFFCTKEGFMGLGRLDTRPGDQVWVFDLGRVPFVVRPRNDDETGTNFDFVGKCYVQGIMQGELWKGQSENDLVLQTIRLH